MSSTDGSTGPPPMLMLSPEAQSIQLNLERAGRLLHERNLEGANSIARWILAQPSVSTFQQAGAHLILAYSFADCVHHARTAVRLYESLDARTEAQKSVRGKWVKKATDLLEFAEAFTQEQSAAEEQQEADKELMHVLQDILDEFPAEEETVGEEPRGGPSNESNTEERG
ncbi:hypothetical protein SCUCBS95973_009641 [Sporothrix curviconia]|uniref:Uncharacterized protein n=1 Tax=Sporothrix curviconia TaxID=1260050 RepID=A0ABP0D070_9PEZI